MNLKIWSASVLLLASAAVSAEPALVISPDEQRRCDFRDGNGDIVSTRDSQIVITNNELNIRHLRCQAEGIANDTGRAIVYNYANTGQICAIIANTFVVLSDNWHQTITPNGRATLVCHADALVNIRGD